MKVQSLMSAYLDCELPGVEMLAMRQHLNDCSECGSEFEGLLRMKRAFGEMQPKLPAEDLASRICYRLDNVSPHENAVRKLYKHLTTVPVRMRVATVGMCLFAMLFMVRTSDITPTATGGQYAELAPVMNVAETSRTRQIPEILTIESTTLNSMVQAGTSPQTWEVFNEFAGNTQFDVPRSTMLNLTHVNY